MKGMKIISLFASALLFIGVAGCSPAEDGGGGDEPSGDGGLVVISMPTSAEERWNKDGAELKRVIEEAGYTAELSFAQDKVEVQNAEIENAINKGAEIIVIAAKDGSAVGPAVEKAREAGIKVIAYDRLIMNTEAVDYYVTFQLEKVGVLEANYVIEKLGLDTGATGPFNIEIFAGSADDNNAKFFFKGAWDLLQPYFATGVLVSPSGKVTAETVLDNWQDISIQDWSNVKAQEEMTSRLAKYDGGAVHLDAVLSPYDGISQGVIRAIEGLGLPWAIGSAEWPWITGQDATNYALYNIRTGAQGETVWKDTRVLAAEVGAICVKILKGEEVTTGGATMDNGVFEVPSILLDSVSVTLNGEEDAKGTVSVQTVVDSGYTTEDAIAPEE